MAYSSIDDVAKAAGGREKLRQLTDLESTDELDEAYVLLVVEEADSMINSYLEKRYAVPLAVADVSEVIRMISSREAVHILRERREALTPAQDDRHAERVAWLTGVADGRISPGLDPRPSASAHVRPEIGNREAGALTLTRKKFEGFT